MLDLGLLAEALLGGTGRVRGDEARRQVTELLEPSIAALMAEGMTRVGAVNRLLADHRRASR